MVTREKALQQQQIAADEMRQPPLEIINRVRNSEWARHGEAGPPLTLEEYQSYQYPEEELGRDYLRKRGLLPTRKPSENNAPTPRKQ